jgi:hypothetical protein
MRTDKSRTGKQRRRRAMPAGTVTARMVAGGMVVVALVAGGCAGKSSGAGVASVGSAANKPAPASTGNSEKNAGLAYSRCMRSHGVPKFPDPNADGGISFSAGSGVDPNSPQFKTADQACASQRPHLNLTPAQQNKMRAANIKYAQCVRSHGIADYPDPKADGGVQIQITPGSDLAPTNPAFQAADRACRHFQANLPGLGGKSLSGVHGPGGGS